MRIKYFLITAILVTAVLCSAGFVKAQTVDNSALITQLKAQIQALMQQIAALQDQQGTTQTWCHTFNANIGVGVKKGNPEIDALTVALQKEGIIEQGTTFSEGYDENLASAVTGFQEKYTSEILTPLNLKHGTGYIGKSTRAKLNALYGCQTVCTQDAKQCPDGSYVSRTGPSCEFAQCPTTQCTTDSDCPQPTCTSPTNTGATSTCLGSVNKCINGKCILTPTTPSITVTSPNGGETWAIGETHNITWTSTAGIIGNVAVWTQQQGGSAPQAIIASTPNTGSASWTIPANIAPANNYRIGVSGNNNNIVDWSNNNLTITATNTPSITILSPNGGETYKTGDSITVNWQTTNVPSFQKLDVIRLRAYPNGQEYYLAYNVLNDGQEVILISSSVPVGAYTLEIKTYVNGVLVMDSSDSYFKIVSVSQCSSDADCPTLCISCPLYTTNAQGVGTNCGGCTTYKCVDGKCVANTTPSVTVLSPNGGESWLQNSTQTVFWSSVNIPSSNLVKIVARYYKDIYPSTAYTDYTLVESTLNDGAEKVDIIGFSTGIYTIQVKTIVNNVVIDDWSDSYFKITSVTIPSITVTSPNGGEIWEIGSKQTIKWTSTNIPSSHLLYHIRLRDSVGKEIYLLYNTINDGEETIVVSSPLASGLYRLEIKSEVDGYTVFDTSDGEFKITSAVSPSITVTSPNGGEQWQVGQTYRITWSSVGLSSTDKVSINIRDTATVSSTVGVVSNIPALQGYYDWKVYVYDMPTSDNYSIGVYLASNPSVNAASNNFTILYPTSITVTSPNGGETLTVGQTYNITWTSQGSSLPPYSSIDLLGFSNGQYMLDYKITTTALTSSGSYSWIVPSSSSIVTGSTYQYKVDVTLGGSGTTFDYSDNYFTIVVPTASVPSAPSNLTATVYSSSQINLSWQDNSSNETGFKVERSTDGINFTEVIANPYPNVTTFYDGNRTSGTTYYYRVRAYNNSGNSAYSNIASATAPAITTSITVTSPNGGETLIEGQTYDITWKAQGAYQQYSLIKLYNYVNDQAVGTFQYQITNTALTASGSYSWTVPTTGIPAGSTYKISVMLEGVVGSIWDVSDNYISIVAPTTNLNVL